jgi:hypothetical protein
MKRQQNPGRFARLQVIPMKIAIGHRRAIVRAAACLAVLSMVIVPVPGAAGSSDSHPAWLPRIESQRVELISQVGGLVTAVVPLPDGSALAAEGARIIHVDVSGAVPGVLSQLDPGYGVILDLVTDGGWLYALTEEGLLVFGGYEDGRPALVSVVPGSGQTLAAGQGLVLVAARQAGLRVVQIDAARGTAQAVAQIMLDGPALDVAFQPGAATAYVAAGDAGVAAIDLSRPESPQVIWSRPDLAPASAVGVTGTLIAVSAGRRVVWLDPAAGGQQISGVYSPLQDGRQMVIENEYVYIADAVDGLKIIWLAAPDRPIQIYGESGQPSMGIALFGDIALLVGPGHLRILDVANHFRPVEIGRLALRGSPQDVRATAGRAFVALGDEGVAVVSLDNLSSPRLTRLIPLAGPAHALQYDERGLLHVAAGDAGLAIVDVSERGGEVLLGTLPMPGAALDVDLRETVVYLAVGEVGVAAVETIHPGAPVLAAMLPPDPGRAFNSVTVSGKRAFLPEGDKLVIADISSPEVIGRLAQIDVPAEVAAIGEGYLYALSGDAISIYSARTTVEPVFLRTYTGLGYAARIASVGDRIFVSGAGDGPELVALSALVPGYPIELDSALTTGQAYRASAAGDSVWLARGYRGLLRYEVSEGGALTVRGEYASLADASHLAGEDQRMLAGGQEGWSLLAAEDAAPPVILASVTSSPVRDLALSGDTVAVAAGEQGVNLYRLADSGAIAPVARQITRGPATGVAMDGEFVYVSDAQGLSIFDRRYLSPVTQVATPAPASHITLHGGLVYLPLRSGHLAIVDRADPTGGIRIAGTLDTGRPVRLIPDEALGQVYGVADDGLFEIRVSQRSAITMAHTFTLPMPVEQGFAGDGHLWLQGADGTTLEYDASPGRDGIPRFVDRIDPGGRILLVDEPFAVIDYGDAGVGFAVLAEPGDPSMLYDEAVRAAYGWDRLLLTLGAELAAWDISQPSAPRRITGLVLPSGGNHISPGPDNMLLLSLDSGLAIVRWDGAQFEQVGQLGTPGAVERAVWARDRAYLGMDRGGLLVVDVGNPEQPASLFSFTSPTGQFVHDLHPIDDGSLLVSWEGGVDLLDISRATDTPRLVATIDAGVQQAFHLSVSGAGDRAALAAGEDGVALLDISTPTGPDVVALADTPGTALRAAFDGDALYVADGLCGMRVLDVTQLAAAREQGYWRSGFAGDVAPGELPGTVYLADGSQMVSLRYNPEAPPEAPPLPQQPGPRDGEQDVSLIPTLNWGPPPDPCQPLTYSIYFGVTDDPPLVGQVSGEPSLQVGELDPLRNYYWRIAVSDGQGDTISGPLWQFTTTRAASARTRFPAPPLFLERLRISPLVAAVLIGMAVVGVLLGGVLRRARRR